MLLANTVCALSCSKCIFNVLYRCTLSSNLVLKCFKSRVFCRRRTKHFIECSVLACCSAVVEEQKLLSCGLGFFFCTIKFTLLLCILKSGIYTVYGSCVRNVFLKCVSFFIRQMRELINDVLSCFLSCFKLVFLLVFTTIFVIVNGLLNSRIACIVFILFTLIISFFKNLFDSFFIRSILNPILKLLLLIRSQIRILINKLLCIFFHLCQCVWRRSRSFNLLLVEFICRNSEQNVITILKINALIIIVDAK